MRRVWQLRAKGLRWMRTGEGIGSSTGDQPLGNRKWLSMQRLVFITDGSARRRGTWTVFTKEPAHEVYIGGLQPSVERLTVVYSILQVCTSAEHEACL